MAVVVMAEVAWDWVEAVEVGTAGRTLVLGSQQTCVLGYWLRLDFARQHSFRAHLAPSPTGRCLDTGRCLRKQRKKRSCSTQACPLLAFNLIKPCFMPCHHQCGILHSRCPYDAHGLGNC